METRIEWTSRAVGLLVGIAVAWGGVASWRLPRGTDALGADVRLISTPSGELEVSPVGPFLVARELRAGSGAGRGEMVVRNQTGAVVSVRVRALPSLPDLDDLLMVRVDMGDTTLFEGALARLRSGSDWSTPLVSGERRVLRAATWIPAAVAGGYEGRVADVGFELEAEVMRP